ncbi:hypothetical protein [Candidatus Nitrospira bockiana]
MMCPRCKGLMAPVDLRDWVSGTGQDNCKAFRCIACGEIVDALILQNRGLDSEAAAARRKSRARHNLPVIRA